MNGQANGWDGQEGGWAGGRVAGGRLVRELPELPVSAFRVNEFRGHKEQSESFHLLIVMANLGTDGRTDAQNFSSNAET